MLGVPPNLIEAEADRRDFANVFLSTHLGRTVDCLPCHNSEESVTDAADPELDRFWPLPGAVDAALFGANDGFDLNSLGIFFRRHGVQWEFRIDEFGQFRIFPPIDLMGGPIPDGFDGCAELIDAAEPGCGDCSCGAQVYEENESCWEDRWTEECASACLGVTNGRCPYHEPDGGQRPFQPWGMYDGCGEWVNPAAIVDDPGDGEGWFGGPLGSAASVYDLDRVLRAGFDELRRDGMTSASPSGPASAAHMIATRFADRVWAEAFGRPLTIPHGFPRNEAQHDRLLALSEVFVAGGYSLADVLVVVTEDALFNQPIPSDVQGQSTYYYPPVVDPWSVEAEDEEQRLNGLGDLVHRPDPRVLVRAARSALGWRPAEGFPISTHSFHGLFQVRTGAYITWSEPGFEGIDLQWLSAWESRFETCEEPVWELLQGGCEAAPERSGCPGCECFVGVCEERPQCCSGPWDAACAESCRRFNACRPDQSRPYDWIDELLDAATDTDATWEQTLVTLKTRLVSDPVLTDADERAILEEIVGALDAPIAASDSAEDDLRTVCSALLSGAEFLLVGLPPPPVAGAVPGVVMPGDSFADHCEALSAVLFSGDVECLADDLAIP
jgi:hypothetical protein